MSTHNYEDILKELSNVRSELRLLRKIPSPRRTLEENRAIRRLEAKQHRINTKLLGNDK